jgi:hypothetical protein
MRWLLCLLAVLPCLAQNETCAVEGQVFNLATGEPVRKAQVALRPVGSSSAQPLGAYSDSGGRFSITGIPPGRYTMSASRAGFVAAGYSAQGAGRRGGTLSLAPGQHMKDVVFRLTPQGVLTGRVFDEEGDAIAGVMVQALRFGYQEGRRSLVPAASGGTNDIGEYRLAGLSPGRYYLSATYRGQPAFAGAAAHDYAPTYYPGTADPAAAAPIQVIQGNELRGIDVTLSRTRTVRVSGRVTSPSGSQGSGNTLVFLMPREGGIRGYTSRNTTAAREGRFEIAGVIPGSYTIAAHRYEDGRRSTASQPVEVGEAGVENISLSLAPGFDVPGQVRVEGEPEPRFGNAVVSFLPAGEASLGGAMGGRLKADGGFTLSGVAADHYRVNVTGMPENAYVKSARLGEAEMLENGAVVGAGAGPLEIVLSAAGGTVEGVALDDKRQPAPGAVVVLAPGERRRHRRELFKDVATDQYGRFSIKGIAPGDYRLFAWQEVEQRAWQDPEFLKNFEKDAEHVAIRENGREVVQLKLLPNEER